MGWRVFDLASTGRCEGLVQFAPLAIHRAADRTDSLILGRVPSLFMRRVERAVLHELLPKGIAPTVDSRQRLGPGDRARPLIEQASGVALDDMLDAIGSHASFLERLAPADDRVCLALVETYHHLDVLRHRSRVSPVQHAVFYDATHGLSRPIRHLRDQGAGVITQPVSD